MRENTACAECGAGTPARKDPRVPPLKLGECLCRGCYADAVQQRIDTLLDELVDLRAALRKDDMS